MKERSQESEREPSQARRSNANEELSLAVGPLTGEQTQGQSTSLKHQRVQDARGRPSTFTNGFLRLANLLDALQSPRPALRFSRASVLALARPNSTSSSASASASSRARKTRKRRGGRGRVGGKLVAAPLGGQRRRGRNRWGAGRGRRGGESGWGAGSDGEGREGFCEFSLSSARAHA